MNMDTENIWKEFNAALKGFILTRVRDRDAAEDILQEVFLKIHSGLTKLESREKIRPWLFAIARNETINYFRGRRGDLSLEEMPEELAAEPSGTAPTHDDFEPCLRALARLLPDRYREAFLLSELEGLTQKEMGERLGLSLSGAKSRVQRGREKMKNLLLDCCYFEFDRNGRIEEVRPRAIPGEVREEASCVQSSTGGVGCSKEMVDR